MDENGFSYDDFRFIPSLQLKEMPSFSTVYDCEQWREATRVHEEQQKQDTAKDKKPDTFCVMLAKRIRGLTEDWNDFAGHTSAHGLPRASASDGFRRWLWYLLFIFCFSVFVYQAYLIIQRFHRNDIIVGVEIKFERIKFPAVTVCNMNPYKNSLARESATIKAALESFESAIDRSSGESSRGRSKRSIDNRYDSVRAAYIYCIADGDHYVPNVNGDIKCICSSFSHDAQFWNCAPAKEWKTQLCGECDSTGNCGLAHNLTTHICYCHDGYCLEADNQIKIEARWPLHLSTQNCSNSSCICISPESNEKEKDDGKRTATYCRPASDWKLSECHSCDWWGRCLRSDSLMGKEECICDRESYSDCYAVERTKEYAEQRDAEKKKHIRIRRQKTRIYERILSHYEGLLAVYSMCKCDKKNGCLALKEMESYNASTCLCFYNKKNDQIWPCYEPEQWKERKCTRCNTFGDCMYSEKQNVKEDCFCAMPIKMCVRIDPPEGNATDLTERIVKFWEILPSTTVSPMVKKKQDREKAYGYTGVKDPIALKAKAMENIIFAVDQLTEKEKWGISYSKGDFIQKCSFNGKECNVATDFESYLDPSYGACFTYVASKLDNMTNDRAGPAFGLRLEVFVNVTEYLPTTEAAGVRLTVHSHEEQPFPDTLGYSAPTGFVSSFGIRLKSMSRLPAPYGDCIKEGKDDDFIYTDKQYSTEGCQRSCIQRHLNRRCGCGDPRFPPYRSNTNCPVDDPEKRECLKTEVSFATRNPQLIGCKCRQPCSQDVYTVSFSASRWPAVPGESSGCPNGMPPQHCLLYKREQGAMIEVFFEQLNYESLLESEAYGWSNLFSDFGGQFGLWMGVSVITMMELIILIFEMFLTLVGFKSEKRRKFSAAARKSISSYRQSYYNQDSGRTDKDSYQSDKYH